MRQLIACASSSESTEIKKKLEQGNIPFFEMKNSDVGVNPETTQATGIKIMVNDGDFEKATALIQ